MIHRGRQTYVDFKDSVDFRFFSGFNTSWKHKKASEFTNVTKVEVKSGQMKSYFTNLDFPKIAGDFPAQRLPFGGQTCQMNPNEVYICTMSLEMTLLGGYPNHLWKQQN